MNSACRFVQVISSQVRIDRHSADWIYHVVRADRGPTPIIGVAMVAVVTSGSGGCSRYLLRLYAHKRGSF